MPFFLPKSPKHTHTDTTPSSFTALHSVQTTKFFFRGHTPPFISLFYKTRAPCCRLRTIKKKNIRGKMAQT